MLGDGVRDKYLTRPMCASILPAYLRRGPGLCVGSRLLQILSLTHGYMRGTPRSLQGSAKECRHATRQISSRLYYIITCKFGRLESVRLSSASMVCSEHRMSWKIDS